MGRVGRVKASQSIVWRLERTTSGPGAFQAPRATPELAVPHPKIIRCPPALLAARERARPCGMGPGEGPPRPHPVSRHSIIAENLVRIDLLDIPDDLEGANPAWCESQPHEQGL